MNRNLRIIQFSILVSAWLTFSLIHLPSALATDGSELFKTNKCNGCHSVSAAGIEIVKDEGEEKGDNNPPDLSGEGLKQDHDAAWIGKFLQKKEKLNKKQHLKKFKGSTEDLEILAQWLTTLKTEDTGKAK